MTWYHGATTVFETFDPAFIGSGHDELGSGFYFTDRYETAVGYASRGDAEKVVLVVELDLKSPLPVEGGFTRHQIEQLLRRSPNFQEMLENFGDAAFEGEAKVVRLAIDAYASTIDADALTGLNSLSNDFYRGDEALFLRNVHDIAGYDGLVRKKGVEMHAVAWLPEQIKIVKSIDLSEATSAPGLR